MATSMFELLLGLQQAWLKEQQRALTRLMSLRSVFEQERATKVGTTPSDVVFTRGSLRLLRYRRREPARYAEPLLLCYALVNRPYILDLQPTKSVVGHYLARGFEVYLMDWGVPSDEDRGLNLEHYVCGLLQETVDFVLKEHERARRLHMLGYCMGGTLATIFAALRPEPLASLTLLASPIDFSGRDNLINVWADRENFDVDAFVDRYGNCPASFLQACFLLAKPIQNLLQKRLTFLEQMDDPTFVEDFLAMERWVNDNIPVAGETFREFVKKLYQENQLVQGKLELAAERVDLRRVRCPLLLLTAKNDHLVPPDSTEGIRGRASSEEIHTMTIDSGHVGLVVSGRAQKVVWPEATRWLSERSTEITRAEGAPGTDSRPAERKQDRSPREGCAERLGDDVKQADGATGALQSSPRAHAESQDRERTGACSTSTVSTCSGIPSSSSATGSASEEA